MPSLAAVLRNYLLPRLPVERLLFGAACIMLLTAK